MGNIKFLKLALAVLATLGVFVFALLLARNQKSGDPRVADFAGAQNRMEIKSSAFENGGVIPSKYACNGENVSPPLEISDVPGGTKSLALILHDPDAPVAGGWTHWVLLNIDPSTTNIAENSFPPGAIQALPSSGKPNYSGPCPPSGTHHYEFRLYALDKFLTLDGSANKVDVEKAMDGHILDHFTLIGLYSHAQ